MLQKMSANSAQNLKSGFQKCGLFPHNRDKVLQRLPNRQLEENVEVRELLSESFLENLRATRTQVTATRPYQRRRRVNVPAGRGITAADLATETMDHATRSVHSNSDHSELQLDATTTAGNVESVEPEDSDSDQSVPIFLESVESEHSDSDHSQLQLDATTTAGNREFLEPEHSDSDQSVPFFLESVEPEHSDYDQSESIFLRNVEATNLVSAIETTTHTVLSSSCQPSATTTEKTNDPRSVLAVASNKEPQPGASTTSRRPEKRRKKTMKLIKKPTKSMRSLVKSHPKKKKFHQDSDDSVSDSRISFQESDCSTNWCDLEDSEKENDMENKSTENEFQENRVD